MRPSVAGIRAGSASTSVAEQTGLQMDRRPGQRALHGFSPAQEPRKSRPSQAAPSAALRSFASLDKDRFLYSAVTLHAPMNKATIRDNEGNVTVAVGRMPPLRGRSRRVESELSLDGGALDTDLSSAGAVLPGLDRRHPTPSGGGDGQGRESAHSQRSRRVLPQSAGQINDPWGPAIYPPLFPSQLVPKQKRTEGTNLERKKKRRRKSPDSIGGGRRRKRDRHGSCSPSDPYFSALFPGR